MILGGQIQVTQSTVKDTGLTNISQLLDPVVINALDSNGNGQGVITGIDPGAGMMITLNSFITGNSTWSNAYTVTASSGAGMLVSLATAYAAKAPIVVTLWSPHWAFSKYNLTYLQDDIGLYGPPDNVVTLARQHLNTTNANAQHLYNILTRFNWTMQDIQSVMLAIQNGATPAVAAQNWISNNTATVKQWVGTDNATGSDTFNYAYVGWSDTIANSNVLKLVLEQSGYTINFQQITPTALYQGLSTGTIDFTSSAWLPYTQANYWNAGGYNQSIDWIHINLSGAKVGLVVPTYMTNPSYWANKTGSTVSTSTITSGSTSTSSSVSTSTNNLDRSFQTSSSSVVSPSNTATITSTNLPINPFYIIFPLSAYVLVLKRKKRKYN